MENKLIKPYYKQTYYKDHLWEEELKLAERLKDMCDGKGKERNPSESAVILHDMGMLYKQRRPDKLSLIRSAVLLNSAVARQSDNAEFKKDLDEFCSEILQISGAKKSDANLVEISNEVAEKIKVMRNKTKESLEKVKMSQYDVTIDQSTADKATLIQDVQSIQNKITDDYTQIMRYISDECEKIIGNKPCKYTITGIGSLARREITPYSDFDHIILLEEGVQNNENIDYNAILEYFRWFSVIFHIIVINLKETIVPRVAIPSLNNHAVTGGMWFHDNQKPRGVSFDGLLPHACKLPLGRMEKTKEKRWTTELIKPVSEMLLYLDEDSDLKNGYHLKDILLRTCFVYGDEALYQDFNARVKTILEKGNKSHHSQLIEQLKVDLQNFNAFKNLNAFATSSNFDVKRVVYRACSIFLSAIGRAHCIEEGSSFAIINHLMEKKIIDDETAQHLKFAIAIACLCRLKVYIRGHSQDNYVGQEQLYDVDDNNVTTELIEIIGEKSIVDYFTTAYILQRELRNAENLHNLQLKISLEPEVKFMILSLLNLNDRIISDYGKHNATNVSLLDECWIRHRVADAYYDKHEYDKSMSMFDFIEQQDINDARLKGMAMYRKAWCLYELDRYEDGIKCSDQGMNKVLNSNISEGEKYRIMCNLALVNGLCKYEMGLHRDAISAYSDEWKYLDKFGEQDHYKETNKEIYRARCLYNIGLCLCYLGDYGAAIEEIKKSLAIREQHNFPVNLKCGCYNLLGCCYIEKAVYSVALEYFQLELDLRLRFIPSEKQGSDEYIKRARDNIRVCEENLTSEQS